MWWWQHMIAEPEHTPDVSILLSNCTASSIQGLFMPFDSLEGWAAVARAIALLLCHSLTRAQPASKLSGPVDLWVMAPLVQGWHLAHPSQEALFSNLLLRCRGPSSVCRKWKSSQPQLTWMRWSATEVSLVRLGHTLEPNYNPVHWCWPAATNVVLLIGFVAGILPTFPAQSNSSSIQHTNSHGGFGMHSHCSACTGPISGLPEQVSVASCPLP